MATVSRYTWYECHFRYTQHTGFLSTARCCSYRYHLVHLHCVLAAWRVDGLVTASYWQNIVDVIIFFFSWFKTNRYHPLINLLRRYYSDAAVTVNHQGIQVSCD